MDKIRGDSNFDAIWAISEDMLEGDVGQTLIHGTGDRETNDADDQTRQSQQCGTPPTTH
jgi:hypothetical protein